MSHKFALIDQSIKGTGGHHLEYAVRVLDAAQKLEYVPVLGAGVAFEGGDDLPFKSSSTFRYSFWENLHRTSALGELFKKYGQYRQGKIAKSQTNTLIKKYQKLYSQKGLDLQRSLEVSHLRDDLLEIIASDLSPIPSKKNSIVWHRYKVDYFNRFIAALKKARDTYRRLPYLLRLPTHYLLRAIRFGIRSLSTLLKLLTKLIIVILGAPFAIVAAPFILKKPHRPAFAEDCKQFIKNAKLRRGDVLFVPTLGETELLGIADLCSKYAPARELSWCLLLRRDLYSGRPIHHASQGDTLSSRRFRLAFEEIKKKTKGVDIKYFTDTDLLTDQYNRPRSAKFQTLPIPVGADFHPRPKRENLRPITMSYLGDARDEKGFPLLSSAMDLIYKSHIATQKVKLWAQSNYNLEGGEPGSVASRLSLLAFPHESCDLVEGPFSSEEYVKNFDNADILLIPYEPEAYASRSSGVFAEALSGGRPTIVTRGSWMATILEPYRQSYLQAIEENMRLPAPSTLKLEGASIVNKREMGEPTLGNLGAIEQLGNHSHLYFKFKFPRVEKDLHVSINCFFADIYGDTVSSIGKTTWMCQKTLRSFVTIPPKAASCKIVIEPLDGISKVVPDLIVIQKVNIPATLPIEFGGAIVEPTPIGLATGMKEIADNYENYERMSRFLSKYWLPYCDADTLVSSMLSEENTPPSPEFYASKQIKEFLMEWNNNPFAMVQNKSKTLETVS